MKTLYDVHKQLNKNVKVCCEWFDFDEMGDTYKDYNLTVDKQNYTVQGRFIDIYNYFIVALGDNVDEYEIEQYSFDIYIMEE